VSPGLTQNQILAANAPKSSDGIKIAHELLIAVSIFFYIRIEKIIKKNLNNDQQAQTYNERVPYAFYFNYIPVFPLGNSTWDD